MKSTFWYWFFAIIITLGAMVYQRVTGPTHPKRVKYEINGVIKSNSFPLSGDSDKDCPVTVEGISDKCDATLYFRHYPSKEEWNQLTQQPDESSKIILALPKQSAAGKLEYYVVLRNLLDGKIIELSKELEFGSFKLSCSTFRFAMSSPLHSSSLL